MTPSTSEISAKDSSSTPAAQPTSTTKTIATTSPSASSINPFFMKHAPENRMQNYCYRHHPDVSCNRQADAKQMEEIQHSLNQLDKSDQEAISHVWSIFSAAPASQRTLMLKGLLAQCCFPQLSQVAAMLDNALRLDFITALPVEIAFKILTYLDSSSLCRAAMVSRAWKRMADDDIVWHRLCEQHIDKKCTKCGWGLPLLEKKRLRESKRAMELRTQQMVQEQQLNQPQNHNSPPVPQTTVTVTPQPQSQEPPKKKRKTRPWKEVYAERYVVEANWRGGRHRSAEFLHTSPVLCLQFDEQYLISGTSIGIAYIWDIETGKLVRKLSAHAGPINALKFDSTKLVTGSTDKIIRIWNYKTGASMGTFNSHASVQALDFDQTLIVSGCADGMIRIWDFKTKTCFTLAGHREAVTSVRLHSESSTLFSGSDDATVRMWDLKTRKCVNEFSVPGSSDAHVAQISCVLPLFIDHLENGGESGSCTSFPDDENNKGSTFAVVDERDPSPSTAATAAAQDRRRSDEEEEARNQFNSSMINRSNGDPMGNVGKYFSADTLVDPRHPTHILTGSLDATIKMWDIRTGKLVRTLFGHIEGVWALAADSFRVVSASHDKTVKVWDLQSGRNWHTFHDHTGPVCCIGLSDTRMASGSDDCRVLMQCFDDFGSQK
ncbi:hypothetical protein DV495_000722 [Geotrichum candidum]|uniref:Similar to Saccharomyces cerevisiae YIL046W MET30 F-box protein containing five copies of the WD40 motif n=1 Tax=Geotrichum candidum TaxID=1173061 RepID=A0A0J9XDY5_GEOCN|nr:hypothetical protein DV454_001744 [Geotrichum candidum]KAI9213648.1 hypothetical protein DS838_001436 [Geotrichum bryndzae]KAF5124624.1 hypothetical protein DV452_000006 [Geotrichum candidum]KAF5135501.1 hypothetical protein DV495_000722 [Geotrichum candidum]KAF7501484.1 hypothetical protein DV113_000563 [Geotrichum candidum]